MSSKTATLPDLHEPNPGFIGEDIGDKPDIPPLSRRKFLRRILAGGVVGSLGGLGYAYGLEPVWLDVVRKAMPIEALPAAFNGFRIIQLSDFHVGAGVPMDYLNNWVDWVNGRKADLVVVTGDMVHHGQNGWNQAAAILVARLRAAYGVLTVLGNHDWLAMSMGGGTDWWADRVATALALQGVCVLRNESLCLKRGSAELHIAGLDDYWGNRFDPDRAFAKVPKNASCIALLHNPDGFLDLLDKPAEWTLSGHTHGGQVNIPLFGPLLVPVKNKQFVAGRYQLAGRYLYINRGIGWTRRIRFNARPEITEFTLRGA